MSKYRIIPLGGGGITPEGTLNIRSEGVFDVTDYASVDVDIFDDTTTKTITNNGTYNASDDNVLGYSQVTVDVPASAVDTGTKTDTITINGTSTIDVVGYASHEVTVDVPASAVDSGTKQITSNGNGQDVVGYAAVDVNVPNGTETITITENGTYSPTSPNVGFAEVTVNVTPQEPDYFYINDTGGYSGLIVQLFDRSIPSEQELGPRPVLYYSTDKVNWTEFPASGYLQIGVQKTYFYGENPVGMCGWGIHCNGAYEVGGNIQTLLDRYGTRQDVPYKAFSCLFYENQTLKQASNLVLAGTHLQPYCYSKMFLGCTYLVTPPSILGTVLSERCCSDMFNGCQYMTQVPLLHATKMATYCYSQMFGSCSSLVTVPENLLQATNLAPYCYSGMFNGCFMLENSPKLPARTLATGCYTEMFNDCGSPNFTPPELPATTLESSCYANMFAGCTYLTKSPKLVATTLAYNCYSGMFTNCGRLNKVYLSYAGQDWASGGDYSQYASYWLGGVAATGTVINGGNANLPLNSASGVPTGWTMSQADYFYIENPNTRAQTLNAVPISTSTDLSLITTLEYSTDATNWTSWTASGGSMPSVSIPANSKLYLRTSSPLNTSGAQGISLRVTGGGIGDGVTLHGDIRTLVDYTNPNLDTLSNSELYMLFDQQDAGIMVYNSIHDASGIDFSNLKYVANMSRMFRNNQYMSGAPDLSSITARGAMSTSYNYSQMYYNCSRLNDITVPSTPLSNFSAIDWVNGVAATGTMHVPTNQTIPTGTNGIPSGWTRVDY